MLDFVMNVPVAGALSATEPYLGLRLVLAIIAAYHMITITERNRKRHVCVWKLPLVSRMTRLESFTCLKMRCSLSDAFVLTCAAFGIAQLCVSATESDVAAAGPEVSGNGALTPSSSLPFEDHNVGYYFSLSLSSAFPDDLEVSDYCLSLLRIFGERYVNYVKCLVSYTRPVQICEKCYTNFNNLKEIFANISSDAMGPDNVSCVDSLIRFDRLMLVYNLYHKQLDIWESAACSQCLTTDQRSLNETTLYFLTVLNRSASCFDKHKQGNHSELCKECKAPYHTLSELYNRMEKNQTLCIDLEDKMNVTRRLWSKTYNCSVPREETIPVIAVSSFMLFLPVIFYLSNFLHSEQKKRKLIHPKRAKSNQSLMNIQEKFS
ncbi:hypothetical protein ACEWY4_021889 [Coilia grayii]|uniref:Osteopetrosis associated transmembrane protein n=1 Tax=Coilia grayii TaxID=363190 RepID=A0ABD1J7S0_9TELE